MILENSKVKLKESSQEILGDYGIGTVISIHLGHALVNWSKNATLWMDENHLEEIND